ncbi:hypothetical protein U1Q18_013616 [Sarracenia purpurea var. burkii]
MIYFVFFVDYLGDADEIGAIEDGGGVDLVADEMVVVVVDQMAKFSSLRTLHLILVNRLAGDLVSALFFSSPLLESLKLEKCTGIQHINVKASNSLKSFTVEDCPNTASIAISAPNLESFRNGFENNEFDCENGLDLLASLKDIEILTISGWFLEWLWESGVIFERLRFQFNKLKQLYWFDSFMNKMKRDYWLTHVQNRHILQLSSPFQFPCISWICTRN